MGFLIRSTFWFSLVLLALPLGGGEDGQQSVGAFQTLMAAREAIGDVAGICERKPDVCETGKHAMHTVGVRAREGARIAFEVLDEKLGEPDNATKTGSVAKPIPVPTPKVAEIPATN